MNKIMTLLLMILMTSCSSISKDEVQRPAPHNNYKGTFVEQHFSDEDPNDHMMRACKNYGGLNQDSVNKKDSDLLLQDIFEFQCNFADKDNSELNIEGKSTKRLNGSIAKKKCERLGFKVGSKEFATCMEELTR